MLAVYSLATYAGRRVAAILGAATIALTALAGVVDPQPHDLNDVLVPTLASAIAWLAGFATAAHRRTIALLTERANRLERDRAADARRVAQEERLLMARELHDITAHHLSVIAVEAEAGGSILPERVEDARSMFQAIAGNARTALTDLRRTLGALRDGESAEREPQPGLGDLPALLDQVRETGVTVRLTSRGSPLGVPAGHGRSAYRIVQEALTNAVRHSGAGTIEICLDYSDSALDIDVQDDGTGPRPSGSPSGHGLLGMRERVRLLGGMLDLGVPATGHGFRVHARLPR
jgi:signal transduction histidine kinase